MVTAMSSQPVSPGGRSLQSNIAASFEDPLNREWPGHQERLSFERLAGHAAFARKDHPQRDQEQHDATRDAECFLLEAQEPQKIVAEEEEHEQHAVPRTESRASARSAAASPEPS